MNNLKNILWFAKENKKTYTIGILSLIIAYIFIPIPSWLIGVIIDEVKSNTLNDTDVRKYVILLFGSVVLLYITEFVWHYYIFGNSFQSGRDTRRRMVKKILGQTPPFFIENSTGSLMSKATNDVSGIQTLTGYGILAFFDATLYPFSLIMIMGFSISWKLTLLSIIVLPLIILITKKLGKSLRERHLAIQKDMEKLNESVLENVTGIRVIKGFSTQEIAQKRFDKRADKLYSSRMKQARLHSMFIPTGRLVPAISLVIALIFGERFIGSGEITLGKLVSFIMYLGQLSWPMFAFGDLVNVVQESSAALGRIQEIYDYKDDLTDREDAVEYDGKGNIEFKNFNFKYPKDSNLVLSGINLVIESGKTLGIVGRIGSGKTTLVKQLLRFYEVPKGSLLLDGNSVEKYKIKSIREKFGYVSQQHLLFSKSVYDNIAFGKPDATEEEVKEAIEFAQFTKDIPNLPQGLQTMIGEKGISISGGQKQRISIARAIIKDPEILILDDSLSAVDALTEKNIIENIRDKREGKTTIIIAHRLSGLKHADNIIVLEDGKIIEQGNHEQLIKKGGWYFEQYESQKLGGSDE